MAIHMGSVWFEKTYDGIYLNSYIENSLLVYCNSHEWTNGKCLAYYIY